MTDTKNHPQSESLAKPSRMPVAFVPHGGGPWPFVEMGFDARELAELATYLKDLRQLPSSTPKAVLVISAHWEKRCRR